MNKRLFYAILGVIVSALIVWACTNDADVLPSGQPLPAGQDVSFTLAIPDILSTTRLASGDTPILLTNSGRGGLTNVDMTRYDLRYQLAVYTLGDALTEPTLIWREPARIVSAYEPVYFNLRLTPNRDYRVIAWADFVEAGSQADLHYATADLARIDLIETSALRLNDESRDAFFVSDTICVGSASYAKSLTLRRPFAKLRIVTTDWQLYGQGLEMPDSVRIGYKNCNRYRSLDLLTSRATGTPLAGSEQVVALGSLADEKEYALGYDASPNNRTLIVDYLLADVGPTQEPIHFTFESRLGGRTVSAWDIDTDIPLRRNWLTTLLGNMLTCDVGFTVSIDETFDGEETIEQEVAAIRQMLEEVAPYLLDDFEF